MHLFSTPGRVHIYGGPGNMQLEITDMHCTSGQKNTEALYSFICSKYNDTKTLPAIHSHASSFSQG